MLLSQLSSSRKLKYGGGHPQRRPRDPMERGWCENRYLARVPFGATHLGPGSRAAQTRISFLPSLWPSCSPLQPDLPVGNHKDFSSGRGCPSPWIQNTKPTDTFPAPCWSSATSDLMVMKQGRATKWNWKQWSFMPWNKLLIVGNWCCKHSNLRPDRHYY